MKENERKMRDNDRQCVQQTVEISQVQFLGWLLTRLLLCNDRCPGLDAQKTVESPQLRCLWASSSSWTRLLCPLVQRSGTAQCLVRLWIHVLHHPGWLLEEFFDFLRDLVSRILRSILRSGRHVVDKGSGMFLTGFAGLTHLALCSHDCRQFADRCFSCSRVALENLYIIFYEPPVFSAFSTFEILRVDFFGPSSTHSCECSRAGGAGVAGSLLPGDSAP